MSHNMDFLHRNRIIYKRQPISDKPTASFPWGWYYENGTHEYYALFHSKSQITSYRSLKWHLYVLLYLNPELTKEKFIDIANYISDKSNGFISFDILDRDLNSIIEKVLTYDVERPPKNKLRKVIFKDGTGLSVSDKLKITGKLIGRNKNASESDIYEIMLYLHDKGEKITVKKISEALKVTTRTIYRNLSDELKKEKDQLNEELQS
jgi:hypothetical protein